MTSVYEILKRRSFLVILKRRFAAGLFFSATRRRVKGKGNKINHQHSVLSKVLFDIKGDENRIEIGKKSVLRDVTFHIRGNRNIITIGENCEFLHGATLWVEDEDCVLSIGPDSIIRNAHFAVTENGSRLEIGANAGIGDEVVIRTGDSHSVIDVETGKRFNYAEDVILGQHCGISPRSIILKGVHLRENTIVAAASLVTRGDYEAGIILAGNPAKVIRRGVTWDWNRIPKVEETEKH